MQTTEIKSGAKVKKGTYLLIQTHKSYSQGSNQRYVLLETMKPSSAEFVPADDARFSSYLGYNTNKRHDVFSEEKQNKTLWHMENGHINSLNAIVHLELTGKFNIPPAYAELLYQTEIYGYSKSFEIEVVD